MISVNNLTFSYTNKPYMENVSFTIRQGEIFGFLGPSGAGKSTLQKILTGVIRNYSGSVTINNQEMKHATSEFYEHIGVDFEFPSLYEKLTAKENLKYFGSLYKRKNSIDILLESVGLTHDSNKKIAQFSKGMKSRLNFIKALVHDPNIIFLDEPTSGLDPNNARVMKNIIAKLRHEGKTIILTTHNMHDAQELCDRVAFIIDGKIKIIDTPHNLIMSRGATRIKYSYIDEKSEVYSNTKLSESGNDSMLQQMIKENKLTSIHSSEPNLNDIFIEITGKELI